MARDFHSHVALPPLQALEGFMYSELESWNWKGTGINLRLTLSTDSQPALPDFSLDHLPLPTNPLFFPALSSTSLMSAGEGSTPKL